MAIKAKDIAEKLGVSTATVSLVINNKPGISDKMRNKIVKEINELGYGYLLENNPLEEQKIRNIGFVIYRSGGELLGFNSFFPLIMDGIESRAREYGYNLSYINISRDDVDKQIQYINDSKCCGYVIFATEMNGEDIEPFIRLGIPFVLLDNYDNDKPINCVKVNNEQGTYLAVKYLAEKGHKRVGYLQSGLGIVSFMERKKCAVESMKYFGMENPDKYIYKVGYPNDVAYEGMKRLISEQVELPTAFMTDNDLVAVGAMKALREAGYRIPDDISFIGFDDRPICTMVEPNLTTIKIPRESFGAEAMELLSRLIEEERPPLLSVGINGTLVERESVKQID